MSGDRTYPDRWSQLQIRRTCGSQKPRHEAARGAAKARPRWTLLSLVIKAPINWGQLALVVRQERSHDLRELLHGVAR
jgi:hypothetical protein